MKNQTGDKKFLVIEGGRLVYQTEQYARLVDFLLKTKTPNLKVFRRQETFVPAHTFPERRVRWYAPEETSLVGGLNE